MRYGKLIIMAALLMLGFVQSNVVAGAPVEMDSHQPGNECFGN